MKDKTLLGSVTSCIFKYSLFCFSPWHLSFSFAFFLHGESTVCASVDVRQHPPVRTLTPKRLARINSPEHHANAKGKPTALLAISTVLYGICVTVCSYRVLRSNLLAQTTHTPTPMVDQKASV